MSRGGSVGQHTPPMPDFSGMGRVSFPTIKRISIEEQKKKERLKVKMN